MRVFPLTDFQVSDGSTKYLAVRSDLLQRIQHLEEETKLPSEKELCVHYGVSRITIRRAVDGLVRAGWLIRERGRGTFVSRPEVAADQPEVFADEVKGFWRQQSELSNLVTTRVLRQEIVPADDVVAEHLQLAVGAKVVYLVRLRYVNGFLIQHTVTYLSYEHFPETATHDFSEGSLFDFLGRRYLVALKCNEISVRLEEVSTQVAFNLEISPGERLLAVESTVHDANGPVAYGISRNVPTHSEVHFNLCVPEAED